MADASYVKALREKNVHLWAERIEKELQEALPGAFFWNLRFMPVDADSRNMLAVETIAPLGYWPNGRNLVFGYNTPLAKFGYSFDFLATQPSIAIDEFVKYVCYPALANT